MRDALIGTLPVLQRLALSYAPATAHPAWLALLALDTRLAAVVRAAREPMMAQLRIAWWREQFKAPLDHAPRGEPLLAALQVWDAQRAALGELVDGWEGFAAAPDGMADGAVRLAQGRAKAMAGLAMLLDASSAASAASRMGEGWGLADVASRLSRPEDRDAVTPLIAARDWRSERLPRVMRPLGVLHGLAARAVRQGTSIDALPPAAMAAVLRIGLLGR